MCRVINLIIILYTQNIIGYNTNNASENVSARLYKGEKFPIKYLLPEESVPMASDLEYYIKRLQRTVNYMYEGMMSLNDTEVNSALGMFFMKAILKRVVRDYQNKLSKTNYNILKNLIKKGDDFVTLYVHVVREEFNMGGDELEYRMARILNDDTVQVYSIKYFNKGRIQKWILSNFSMHSYIENMDNITLSREKYAHIVDDMDSFFISIEDSDECLSRIVYNPEPIDLSELRPCRSDPFCRKPFLSSPSIAYALSHRLLNLLMYRHSRRCFIQSQKEDDDLMDTLCAFMYREAVYIARRGFFARDIFLEHVALCSLLGYEEFHRQHWYRKAASWMDDQGCISESHNFMINRTKMQMQGADKRIQKKLRKKLKLQLVEECHSHPMALLMVVLAQAIRHTLNFMGE